MQYKCVDFGSGVELGASSVMPIAKGEEHYFGDKLYTFIYAMNNVAYFEKKSDLYEFEKRLTKLENDLRKISEKSSAEKFFSNLKSSLARNNKS